jgi:regulator of sigma E protease
VTILLALAGLAFLVLVHELAHYFAARAVGLNPFRFMLFFPPTVAKRKLGQTEWGIGLLPLGGFVSIAGMHRPRGDATIAIRQVLGEDEGLSDALSAAVAQGEPLNPEVEAELAAALHGNHKAERELQALQRDLSPNAYWRSAPWRRAIVVGAGPVASALLAFCLCFIFYLSYAPGKVKLSAVLPGYPAAHAGLKAHDEIKAINGHTLASGQLASDIQSSHGTPLILTVKRGERTFRVSVRPLQKQGGWKLGVVTYDNPYHGQLAGSAKQSGRVLWQTTESIGGQLHTIAKTPVGKKGAVSGPVGIVDFSSGILSQSLALWPLIFGLVSLALALTNILPIPPLDGGHLLLAFVEWVRKRPLSQRSEQLVIAWGVVFVVCVFGIGLLNDLLRL